MTAVEFISKGLFDILQEAEDNNIFEVGTQNFKRYIEMFLDQAKEMQKQQIVDAYVDGFKECEKIHEEAFFIQDLSEQYYNETYKKDKL
jgi:hypothetical protein